MNANARIQLVDLARTLSQRPELQLVMSYHSNLAGNSMSISQFWADYPSEQQLAGFKSEIYLHCIGGVTSLELVELDSYLQYVKSQSLSSFSKQLIALFEQLRWEKSCKRLRPGTGKTFKIRQDLLVDFFKKQVPSQMFAGATANALFSAIYLRVAAGNEIRRLPDSLQLMLSGIEIYLDEVGSVSTINRVVELVESIMTVIRQYTLSDMTRSYFSIESVFSDAQLKAPSDVNTLVQQDLEHSAKIDIEEANNSTQQDSKGDRENLPTWHRETEQSSPTFLQFEIEQGTDSQTLGDAMRETDPGDQALALVQGSTSFSKRSEFTSDEPIDKSLTELMEAHNAGEGIMNKFARPIWKFPDRAGEKELETYQIYKQKVWPYRQKLIRTIQMTMEQKQTGPRSDLLYGRLDKKLLRALTDGSYRLFHKKNSPESRLDAAFVLLVDCSASMQDKIEQTKLGITLFHECLTTLRIPHCIIGFWEDADNVTEFDEPNVFQVIMDFESSLRKESGASIVQLEAQQDNRDGFAIRVASKYLAARHEKTRVLLVFSDGEPAAAGYNENGILDAYEAVSTARRCGLEVVGLYLGSETVPMEQASVMQHIYGKSTVVVPAIDHLSDMLGPVLRKLLLKNS